MISYKQYEQKVYEWLLQKHHRDNNFTFSLRKKGSRGSETDHFIGTEKSKYFSTTFWYLPVNFPGSSGDCIGLFFYYTKTGYNYFFEFLQTTSPDGEQNIAALELVKSMMPALNDIIGFQRIPEEETKMFKLRTKTSSESYLALEDMFADINKDLDIILPIVDQSITKVKQRFPQFKAHRLTPSDFEIITNNFKERISRYESTINNTEDDIDFFEYIKNFEPADLDVFFTFLKSMLVHFHIQSGDQRLLFSCRQNRLNFTIGQRYSLYLNASEKQKKFGIISQDKLNDSSEQYTGSKSATWFTELDDLNLSAIEAASVENGFHHELERSARSSYRLHNNNAFEKYAFNYVSNENTIKSNTPSTLEIVAPLNQILYGPPGTGKTYHTVLEAAKIVSGRNVSDYDEALKIFNDNLGSQIEFITFHQNYSYEDFIQGLRPDVENGSALTFHKKDGVFKRIADRALNNLKASKNPASAKRDFDIVFHELIQPLNDDEVSEIEIKMKKSSFFVTEVGEKSIAFRKNIGDSEHTLSIATLSRMYDKGVNDIILGGLQPYYNPILELLLQMGKSEVQSIQKKNYVIIIDEINRANISRVFGELITLIEPDKRFGGKIPMSLTLPSGDPFMVPENLYIIGTMNTADKSIALLDIALRRRFEFVPMYPQYEIEGQTIYYPEVLREINEKICKLKTRDFQIGHAYFMENSDLEHIMNRKVIPLLLEYFMNDEKTVREITKVSSGAIDPESWPMKFIQN